MRGNGITPLKKYQWAKQSNGKYSIFDVEVFRPFEREVAEKEFKLTPLEAPQVVNNFQKEKSEGVYRRVHLEHQPEGVKNAEGFGYIDNLRWDESKEMFFADLVEIEPEYFEQFQQGDLPYRSVEFDFPTKTITGLAVLPSRPSYFNFPNLFLAKSEANVNDLQYFQAERRNILQFGTQFCGKSCNCEKKLRFLRLREWRERDGRKGQVR